MSSEDERILIHRLALGELDGVEAKRAHALIEREPELGELLEQVKELQARVRAAFPEPPPIGDSRAFLELMRQLSTAGVDPYDGVYATRSMRSQTLREAAMSSAPSLADHPPTFAGLRRTSPDWDERRPGAHLFHLREIRREDGLSAELEFYAGDVLAIHNEVLLLSAFAGSYLPTPGSVFGAIADRYGISFASGPPPDAIRYPGGLLHFPGISCRAFDSLWIIEMREPGQRYSLEDLRSTLDTIGARLPDMLADASSITLPLLGTGNQQLNPRDVARELLSALPRWARSPRLRTVRVFTHGLEHVAVLNRALDDRDFSAGNSALLSACQELRLRLERSEWSEPVRAALKDLLEIASAPDPSLQSIALEGRRIAEVVLRMLSREGSVELGLLVAEPDESAQRRAELAAPHLQLLLAHGQSAAGGEPVDSNDAVMVVYAAIRVAEG